MSRKTSRNENKTADVERKQRCTQNHENRLKLAVMFSGGEGHSLPFVNRASHRSFSVRLRQAARNQQLTNR